MPLYKTRDPSHRVLGWVSRDPPGLDPPLNASGVPPRRIFDRRPKLPVGQAMPAVLRPITPFLQAKESRHGGSSTGPGAPGESRRRVSKRQCASFPNSFKMPHIEAPLQIPLFNLLSPVADPGRAGVEATEGVPARRDRPRRGTLSPTSVFDTGRRSAVAERRIANSRRDSDPHH